LLQLPPSAEAHAFAFRPSCKSRRYAAEQALRLSVWSSHSTLPFPENRKLKLEIQTLVQTALNLARGNDSLSVTGERILASHHGAQCRRWRKDGRELYYLGSDGQVYAVPIAFRSRGINVGQPAPLFTIDAEARAAIHSVVPSTFPRNGRRFVIPSMTPGESPAIMVLQDWESLVAK
jgi:hypothetical protein